LVRSGALADWRVPGAEQQVRPLAGTEEHDELLRRKLIEEATEAAFVMVHRPDGTAAHRKLLDECADVLEVLRAMIGAHGMSLDDLIDRAEARAAQSGDFGPLALVWDTGR
jgi:phosphoribosyl-ATP pyrophosphohydrolase